MAGHIVTFCVPHDLHQIINYKNEIYYVGFINSFINCEKKINGSLNDSSDIWVIKYFVNEFKEQTDIGYITNGYRIYNPILNII